MTSGQNETIISTINLDEKTQVVGELQTTEEKSHPGRYYTKDSDNKNLEQLKGIGEEITQLEQKLDAVPNPEQEVLDMSKYNRKQRRKIERNIKHNETIKSKKLDQKANTFVTRGEFVQLFQSAQKLRDRLYFVDILTSALEKTLLQKGIVTEEELTIVINTENEKALAFQEIQKGSGDYDTRIKKCIELKVDPNMSIIPQQIYQDTDLSMDIKIELAKTYNLTQLLKIVQPVTEQKAIS